MRPGHFCRTLLAALEASEGRRKSRKRDQTPDRIGLAERRELLERAVREDPEPQAFEEWLLGYPPATARMVLEEWCLAQAMPQFAAWLERGAPSDDAASAPPSSPSSR